MEEINRDETNFHFFMQFYVFEQHAFSLQAVFGMFYSNK